MPTPEQIEATKAAMDSGAQREPAPGFGDVRAKAGLGWLGGAEALDVLERNWKSLPPWLLQQLMESRKNDAAAGRTEADLRRMPAEQMPLGDTAREAAMALSMQPRGMEGVATPAHRALQERLGPGDQSTLSDLEAIAEKVRARNVKDMDAMGSDIRSSALAASRDPRSGVRGPEKVPGQSDEDQFAKVNALLQRAGVRPEDRPVVAGEIGKLMDLTAGKAARTGAPNYSALDQETGAAALQILRQLVPNFDQPRQPKK